jgi:hypothetical protein
MTNKTYDILKIIATIILPALGTLYAAIASIWGLPFGDQVDKTVLAIVVALDTILGITVTKASSDYNKVTVQNK